jgi:formate hydrogenlyase subunit 3/multisubunit Na+/H+ antiporter MnhD subunit
MLIPMVILGILCIYFGFFSGDLIEHIFEPLANTLLGLGGVP